MRNVAVIFSIFFLSAMAFGQQPAPTTPSPDDIARRSVDLLGGSTAWQQARYLSYTFNVQKDGKVLASFPQKWDRVAGIYQVSGRTIDGVPFDATINIKTKKVHGSIQGRAVRDNPELYQLAYTRFLNDTFWLLMPLKMFDPGVRRTYEGPRSDTCGRTWDLLKLTVAEDQGAGLTPGDVYWPWINRDTGMVEEWDMKLQNMRPDDPPVEVLFHDYRRIAGLLISVRREVRGKGQIVRLDDLQILPEVPKGAFKN